MGTAASRVGEAGGADVITVVSTGVEAEEEEDECLQRLKALRQSIPLLQQLTPLLSQAAITNTHIPATAAATATASATATAATTAATAATAAAAATATAVASASAAAASATRVAGNAAAAGADTAAADTSVLAASGGERMAAHAQRIAEAVCELRARGDSSAAVLVGFEQWHADVAGRVCGNQQELMSRMEAVEALAGKVYKRMNWTGSVVKSNLQHLRAAPSLRIEMERLRNQLSAVTRSYEGLCEELEAAGLEFDCETETICRIDGNWASAGVEVPESDSGVSLQRSLTSSEGACIGARSSQHSQTPDSRGNQGTFFSGQHL
ncbi:hypothetical protein CLOP_g22193 [Closterium sp. NIES-67]|nr:hypothetical protein CLOP_g22193 [Closterium sp. NIES-67]